ncbi:MAG: coiled-coil [candidate division WS6 bacterium 34_10]|jgi:hypothetical protein|uniref:Coiled-coil n=1 Tax=candidate division WS6 bacterium 34_10 TaxID=1641389 RepID=A0A101HHT6_9BACT|nr:MAG: coiled-coil [candidate division WS6 bacterium 34_10]
MKIADLDIDKEDGMRPSPKDRIPMIKEVFELVLGREPSSRELSFYKYGTQDREEIIEKLLNDDEHKKLVEKAGKVPKLEDKVKGTEHKVVKLTQQIKDMEEESKQIKNLLDEKNREIAILRREKQDPYNFTHSDALRYIKGLTENDRTRVDTETSQSPSNGERHFTSVSATQEPQRKNFLDKVYDLIKG